MQLKGLDEKAVISGEHQAELVEAPMPEPRENWELVKVHASALCTEYKSCLAAQPETLAPNEWEELCEAVEPGGATIVGALRPDHLTAISAFSRHGLNLKLHFGIGSWMGCYHWIPQPDPFAGLPAGGLARKPYSGIIPKHVISEMGSEILAGSLRNTQSRQEAPSMLWYSDIEVVRLGKGAVASIGLLRI